jgi:hypothetical protein
MQIMIKTIIFLLLIVTVSMTIFSQTDSSKSKKVFKYSVEEYKVCDKSFFKVIDKVLTLDKKQEYFSPSISYLIQFNNLDLDGGLVFGFEGNTNKRQHLEFFKLKGCFHYKQHDFFICFDSLPDMILQKTNKFKIFESSESYEISEDDSWAQYNWRLSDNNYTLYRRK